MQTTTSGNGIELERSLYVSFELCKSTWQLTFGTGLGSNPYRASVPAGDLGALRFRLEGAKKKLGVGASVPVKSCMEAGRDGFWIHRMLEREGVESQVVDAGSLRRRPGRRHQKTDRLDGLTLLSHLMRSDAGEKDVWKSVRVPSELEEDFRRLERERLILRDERTAHQNRIRGLLTTQGAKIPSWKVMLRDGVGDVRCWNGSPLGLELRRQIDRELARLRLVVEQLEELKAHRKQLLRERPAEYAELLDVVATLQQLKGVGEAISWLFVTHLWWREFQNRKEIGKYLGLCGTPYMSGEMARDLGIGKDGPGALRAMMIEAAWSWLRFQPHSKISLWYQERYGAGSKRSRRQGIVAVARQLSVALWRYVTYGVIPEGAELKAA